MAEPRSWMVSICVFVGGCLNTINGQRVDIVGLCVSEVEAAGQTLADACVVEDVLAEDPQGDCWLFETDCVPDGFRLCEDAMAADGCCAVGVAELVGCGI